MSDEKIRVRTFELLFPPQFFLRNPNRANTRNSPIKNQSSQHPEGTEAKNVVRQKFNTRTDVRFLDTTSDEDRE